MAFDGILMSALCHELQQTIVGSKLSKIAQPEPDIILFTIKGNNRQTYRLLLNVDAGLPYLCLTENNLPSPMTAPNFCMMLRKHLSNGRILDISQAGLERIITMTIEHMDELGDLCQKKLIIEIMGKHSNIIFCDAAGRILDSIKHVPPSVSSLRTVLPGSTYYLPDSLSRQNPLTTTPENMLSQVFCVAVPIGKRLYTHFAGLSPAAAQSILSSAQIDADKPANALTPEEQLHLSHRFVAVMKDIRDQRFSPTIYYQGEDPVDFSAIPLEQLEGTCKKRSCNGVSEMIEQFYTEKSLCLRIRSKSSDLRRQTHTALERNRKKLDLQEQQLRETMQRETYRLYGELLTAYAYQLEDGSKTVTVENYYDDNHPITIPLREDKSIRENAADFYKKYNKQKRMYEALSLQIVETEDEIQYLESIELALQLAKTEDDLKAIAGELRSEQRDKKQNGNKKGPGKTSPGKPLHFLSSDGFHMYVGRNNLQNEYLTFEFATGGDMWFHAKGIPGSHVIVKTEGSELPDRTYEEAGALAALYSRDGDSEKVEVDYTPKKQIKKPPKAHPGFVIYHTNYSLMAKPALAKTLHEVQS